MRTFRVLPTDERFSSLYEEQKEFIFRLFYRIPDDADLKRMILVKEAIDELQARDAMDFLPKGSLTRMEQAYRRQGMPADRIKAAMLENARRMKASKIMALEKRLENGK